MVEIRGFEPLQTEPKSVVLPLHHISIPGAKIQNISEIQSCGWIKGPESTAPGSCQSFRWMSEVTGAIFSRRWAPCRSSISTRKTNCFTTTLCGTPSFTIILLFRDLARASAVPPVARISSSIAISNTSYTNSPAAISLSR